MVRELWLDYLKTNVNLFFMTGMPSILPPNFHEKDTRYQTTWHFYQNLTDFITYTITIANLIGTVMLDEVFPMLASIPPLLHGVNISGRTMILKVRKDFVDDYFQELNQLLIDNINNPIDSNLEFKEIHKSDFQRNRLLTALEFVFIVVSNAFFFIPELLKTTFNPEESHTIMVSWYPYDATVSPYKEITNIGHTITWFLINLRIAACDTLFQSLLILHASQFKHLRYLFAKLFDATNNDFKSGLFEDFGPGKNMEFEQKFQWWVRQHQNTLRISGKLKELFSPLLFCSYIECLVNMCLCVFLTTVESPWTPTQRFAAVFIVGTVFCQLFVICRLGDYLNLTATETAEDGYSPKLFRYSHEHRKNLLMVFQRVNRPLKFSAFGLFHLTSRNYGTLVQGVFSYYMALHQFQVRHYSGHPSG